MVKSNCNGEFLFNEYGVSVLENEKGFEDEWW